MSWARLDDQFPDHVKVMAAGPLASWLHVCGLCYCGRMLTDGFIPTGQVRKLADVDNATELAAMLVRAGLWEEVAGGFQIHDYLEYNPTREKVEAIRHARSEAGRAGGLRSGEARASGVADTVADTVARRVPGANMKQVADTVAGSFVDAVGSRCADTNASRMSEAKSNPDPDPDPESRNPDPEAESPSTRSKAFLPSAPRATRLENEWTLPDDWRNDALEERPDVDPDFEARRFRDYWIGKPGRDGLKLDWRATWRNWIRSAKATPPRAARAASSYSAGLVAKGLLEPD